MARRYSSILAPLDLLADQNHTMWFVEKSFRRASKELAAKLQKITGFSDLKFDGAGILRQGAARPVGGSQSARELVVNAIHGRNVVVIEDASHRGDVAFARVIPGRWRLMPQALQRVRCAN